MSSSILCTACEKHYPLWDINEAHLYKGEETEWSAEGDFKWLSSMSEYRLLEKAYVFQICNSCINKHKSKGFKIIISAALLGVSLMVIDAYFELNFIVGTLGLIVVGAIFPALLKAFPNRSKAADQVALRIIFNKLNAEGKGNAKLLFFTRADRKGMIKL